MTAPPDDTTTDTKAIIAALRAERDAALSEKAALAEALATRNSEYGERIEQQSATIDVLKVMSASPGDAGPVFELIAERAREFCEADKVAVALLEGDTLHLQTHTVFDEAFDRDYVSQFPRPLDTSSVFGRAIFAREAVQSLDLHVDPQHLSSQMSVMGLRSIAGVPIIREGRPIGAISLARRAPGPYSAAQVELLQTFAEQAVISITSAETYRALQTRTSDLQETLEYQTATSDVLKVISRSTFDLQPVLETLFATAARLCDANLGTISLREGDAFRVAATYSLTPEYATFFRGRLQPLDRGSVTGRTALEGRIIHVADLTADPEFALTQVIKRRETALGVPLLRDGVVVGVIVLVRQQVQPFTDRQIELVTTFADQALIAIENTRLLTEQREALEQQTATAEVLQVINASPGDLTPVFDAILKKAHVLCGVAVGALVIYDGEYLHAVATQGYSDQRDVMSRQRRRPNVYEQRLTHGDRLVHVLDLKTIDPTQDQGAARDIAASSNARTGLMVPLRKDDTLLGFISAYRLIVRPFSEKEVALLENFAAQAVIAMENARLLTEQREALERQTATAEVLQVINTSPGNLAPVFAIILDKAMRLCEAAFGGLFTYDGGRFHTVAALGTPTALTEFRTRNPPSPLPGSTSARLLETRRTHHILDRAQEPDYLAGEPGARAMVELGGARSMLNVPLNTDDNLLGYISIYRQEVRPFSDRQIALLESFATQAVIAMENARLITEQREALEQQTATAEVLQVINASPGDLAPVFDAMLEKAMHLCGAAFGTLRQFDGVQAHLLAARGLPTGFAEHAARHPVTPRDGLLRSLGTGQPLPTLDIRDLELYKSGDPDLRAIGDLGGARTVLNVPLFKAPVSIGYFTLYRQDVRAFTDKQIALIENFAAQAVIAMENARLLNEIRQRQAELRITFENMGDGVAMFDETPRLVAWNGKFQEIFNVPDAILEEHRTYVEYVRYIGTRGDFGPSVDVEEQIRRLTEIASEYHAYERIRPDGRVIEIRHNPVPSGGFVLIFSDITERKRNEAELRAARDAAEEASRAIEAAYRELKTAQANLIQAEKMASLGQLTAGIAHEIKNPLNFVNNFAALSVDLLSELKETAAPGFAALSEKQRAEVEDVSAMLTSNLEKITEHGKRADGIVKAMLEHSRGSSGERRMVDLNALIDEALNLAYHGARAQDQSFNVTLERDFGEGIAPIEVNPQDMTRVFLNIFSNGFYAATRRAREGGDAGFIPTLKVTTRDAGEAVEIRVRDNGTGIPADIRDKLFQPFFTTKPTGEGTGLGLSITYDIVTQQHGGSIAVNSKVGGYSEFTIRLPRKP